jgi:hypothetical protein
VGDHIAHRDIVYVTDDQGGEVEHYIEWDDSDAGAWCE